MQISAIILAAGSGKRTGLKYNKVLYEVKGKRVIDYSIETIRKFSEFTEILLVVAENEYEYFMSLYKDLVDVILVGGKERQNSVYKALNKANNNYVMIHDGARPFIPNHSLLEIISNINSERSITLGVKVKDTIQEVNGNRVVRTFDRSKLIVTQTPQAFHKELLIKAHELAIDDSFIGTDDTMLMEKYLQIDSYVVLGDYRNIKLTTIDDIKLLEVILWLELDTQLIFID